MLKNFRVALIFALIAFLGVNGSGFAESNIAANEARYNPLLTKQQIMDAFEAGIAAGATHMLIVWDTYDFDDTYDFVVYSFPGEDVNDLVKYYDTPGFYRVSAVLAMHLDLEQQLSDTRWHTEYP